jgi:Phage tail tube protein
MPKSWNSKTILAKVETTYGTDSAPTGAANAILAMNVTFSPQEGEVIKRALERPFFGGEPFIAQAFRSVLTFDCELVGSGTLGTAPGWGVLLRGCAAAQAITAGTRVEYTPITASPESLTLYFDVDGTKHVMAGARGTAVLKYGINGEPMISFTFTGLFTLPVEATKPTVNYSTFQAPQGVSNANTPTYRIGGIDFVGRDFEFDLGNKIEPRYLIGSESIIMTDREESARMTVEAVPVSTYNPHQIARDGTQQQITIAHGTVAGRKVQIDLYNCQQMPVAAYQNQQNVLEWQLQFMPLPSAGNDQWKITLT